MTDDFKPKTLYFVQLKHQKPVGGEGGPYIYALPLSLGLALVNQGGVDFATGNNHFWGSITSPIDWIEKAKFPLPTEMKEEGDRDNNSLYQFSQFMVIAASQNNEVKFFSAPTMLEKYTKENDEAKA